MMHEKAVIAVAFNKDSELLATGSQDGQAPEESVLGGGLEGVAPEKPP